MYPQVFENIKKEVPIESSDLVAPTRKQWTTETKIFLAFFLIAIAGGAIRKWFTSNTLLANAILLLQMIMPFVLYIFRKIGRAHV